MSTRETLLAQIVAYCERHSITEREFGRRVNRNAHLVGRLRAGQASLATIEEVEAFLKRAAAEDEVRAA